jgi:hypothetical protein
VILGSIGGVRAARTPVSRMRTALGSFGHRNRLPGGVASPATSCQPGQGLDRRSIFRYGMAMSKVANFRVVGVRMAALNPDGKPESDSHFVSVEVDGIVHDIRIHVSTGRARVPRDLAGCPQREEIKRAACKALYDAVISRIRAPRRGLDSR